MKTLLFRLVLITSFFSLFSCKKENSIAPSDLTNESYVIKPGGYLAFKNVEDVVSFGKTIMNPTASAQILEELEQKGFKKRHSLSQLTSRDPNSIYSLIFNEEGLLQVDNVIMKITDDDKFLYTLKEEMSDPETFNKLLNEVYDGLKMNKINVDRDLTEVFDLIDFTADNPFGKLESLYAGTEKRPMFGSNTNTWEVTTEPTYDAYGNCVSYTTTYSQTTTYIFWVGFPGSVNTGNTVTNYNVLGC
ncbi:MAG: hypothetical protein WAT19_02535 [Ferruginibacter sp.]